MTYIDRLIEGGPEASQDLLRQRLLKLEQRISAVPQEELVDVNWSDEEIAEARGISLNPQWVTVNDPRGGVSRFEVAAVVSEEFDEDETSISRSLALIGRKVGSDSDDYLAIGYLYAPRYTDDPPMLMMRLNEDQAEQFIQWESVDAAIFLTLAEQILPEAPEQDLDVDDFAG